ncbi:hypothetical protein [Sphingobium sp. SCG-1]|uniref:hypothetical protein n=1 Tax=Sphingobium sp. SCG-1 TaxID=2072936 RepID=UPI00166F87EB|nr:hypothetical protein [Sphingobium sp. SCG-1]
MATLIIHKNRHAISDAAVLHSPLSLGQPLPTAEWQQLVDNGGDSCRSALGDRKSLAEWRQRVDSASAATRYFLQLRAEAKL